MTQVNIQISLAFIYSNNEQIEFEMKNTMSLILAPSKNNAYKSNKIQSALVIEQKLVISRCRTHKYRELNVLYHFT